MEHCFPGTLLLAGSLPSQLHMKSALPEHISTNIQMLYVSSVQAAAAASSPREVSAAGSAAARDGRRGPVQERRGAGRLGGALRPRSSSTGEGGRGVLVPGSAGGSELTEGLPESGERGVEAGGSAGGRARSRLLETRLAAAARLLKPVSPRRLSKESGGVAEFGLLQFRGRGPRTSGLPFFKEPGNAYR